ncbi:hypothetical protein B5G09_12160 [Alistipes sp. An54]|uniref:FecR domain-containing protein n=1 Tax=Alistipes sp. An54 TaxID=1965645 RepID=UPI000B36965B|nr:FecR domain-containing protein [Alistipes sp. An54]OUN75466.1 hypothetical protein B5G09_12160 [Alistipes sp. An54]
MDDLTLQKYLRNELSEKELVEVLDWLDASPENQRRLDRLDYLSNVAILLGPAEQPAATLRRPMSRWRRTLRWSAGIAAGLLVGLGIGQLLSHRAMDLRSQEFMAITAPNGQSISVTLNDGSHVWLNAGSTLEYPTLFSSRRRQVRVSGEAMFEVEHDASWPFVVETFACEAEVLGTKFNILADADSHSFSAALLEGRLKIRNREHADESLILSPNEEANLVDSHLQLEKISDPDDFRWIDGLMNLNGLTFGEVIDKLKRYYGVQIVVEGPGNLTDRRYHGKIRVSYGIDHALDLLQMMTSDFTYAHDNETNTIYIHRRSRMPMN